MDIMIRFRHKDDVISTQMETEENLDPENAEVNGDS